MIDGTPRRQHQLGRDRRAGPLGNLFIVLAITLLGGALSLTSAPAAGMPAVRASVAVTDPPRTTPRPTAAATLSAPVVTSRWVPVLQEPPATPVPVTPPATPDAAPAAAATPRATPRPRVAHAPATRIQIPAVGIDAPVVNVGFDIVTIQGQQLIQWRVADYAASHQSLSANPGDGGNIVISGHDDWKGEVFRNLDLVKVGDQIVLTTADGQYRYAVDEIVYRKVLGVPLSDQLATALYMAPMPQERLTLVTCWPYGVDDHRLIVIAKPVTP